MRPYIPVLIAVLASAPVAAQSWKWVDERGVTNYGSKPPPGRPAQRVDTQSRNTIDTGGLPQRGEAEDKRQVGVQPLPSAAAIAPARGMDFDTYIRLQRGMSEGELLNRAGSPDYVAFGYLGDIVKSFYYYPTVSDPFTTVIALRGGRIDHIERTKKH